MLRNQHAYFAGLLVLSLLASGHVFAQDQSACGTPVECYEQSLKHLYEARNEIGEVTQSLYEQSLKNLQDTLQYVARLQEEIEALKQSLTDIKSAIERGNPWELFNEELSFSESFKNVIKEIEKEPVKTLKYEYAVIRNGAFRTLTASTWNGGWRVMTSPYMTGDKEKFVLGGSMWIWGTQDPRDDAGVYHLYYYADGSAVSARDGNGLNKPAEGEDKIYRRLRK